MKTFLFVTFVGLLILASSLAWPTGIVLGVLSIVSKITAGAYGALGWASIGCLAGAIVGSIISYVLAAIGLLKMGR